MSVIPNDRINQKGRQSINQSINQHICQSLQLCFIRIKINLKTTYPEDMFQW